MNPATWYTDPHIADVVPFPHSAVDIPTINSRQLLIGIKDKEHQRSPGYFGSITPWPSTANPVWLV
jgi:hypothetical protein